MIVTALPAMGATLLYCALALVWMEPWILSPHDTVADVGDPLHLAHIMAWNAHQLIRDPLRLFDSNNFYPWPQSLSFADHLVPESILVAPVQWITGNAVLAYNLAVFIGLVSSAFSMRWLILEVTGNSRAALVAGVVYAFNSFTLVEAARVNVIHMQWWPVALVFLGRFVNAPGFANALGLALALALQGLSGTYYLVFSALLAPVWIGVAFLGAGKRPTPQGARNLAGAALLTAIPVLVTVYPYMARGLPQSRVSPGVDLMAYVSPATGSAVWAGLLPQGGLGREFKGVLGLTLVGLGIVALVRSRSGWPRALGLIALVTAAFGIALSLGDNITIGGTSYGRGPHHFLFDLLPLQGLRHTPRFNALAVLGCAVLAGLGLGAFLGRSKAATFATLALVAALPLEHWSDTKYGAQLPPIASLQAAYRDLPRAPLVDLPIYPMARRRFWAAYPYFSTFHWNPVPIGRTSFYPPGHDFLAWLLEAFPDDRSISALSRLGIRTVVVHPRIWVADERREKLEALKATPSLVPMKRTATPFEPNVFELGDELYYELKANETAASLCTPTAEISGPSLRVLPMGTTPGDGLDRVNDGDPSTRWSSGLDQTGWYGFQAQLDSPRLLAAVALQSPGDRFPRLWPVLQLRGPGGRWETVVSPFSPEVAWESLSAQLQGARSVRWVIRFDRREVQAFRLVFAIAAPAAVPPFEIEELRAFAECPLP